MRPSKCDIPTREPVQPQVGFIPWGPFLAENVSLPGDEWYEGWRSRDWALLPAAPAAMLQEGQFNPALRYMTGVTTQEAAYYLCEFVIK